MHPIRRNDIDPISLPGRDMWMMASPKLGNAEKLSMNVVRIKPGETVHPAHSHPGAEEFIYVLNGEVEIFVLNNGKNEKARLKKGDSVVLQENDIHMTRNISDEPVELACFFSPASTPDTYRMYENITVSDEGKLVGDVD